MVKIWRVYPEAPDPKAIEEAVQSLLRGELVAFPTETVYGLGANALDGTAVRKIFIAKGRPFWDPLIVHLYDPQMVHQVAHSLPEIFWRLAEAFWPGPLTLVVPKSPSVPDIVTAGLNTIAVRVPSHKVALALIEGARVPIAAPSANRFGRPSPTTGEHVLADLGDVIEGILDAGPTPIGVESTVLDLTTDPPTLLRPGGLNKEVLERVVGKVVLQTVRRRQEGLPSPGMVERHYAPSVPVVLSEGEAKALRATISRLREEGQKPIGILLPKGWEIPSSKEFVIFGWGKWGQWEELAQRLFRGLRELEGWGVSVIVVPLPPSVGLGLALRDRLQKAAGKGRVGV